MVDVAIHVKKIDPRSGYPGAVSWHDLAGWEIPVLFLDVLVGQKHL
jgi:hypothetical protein